MLAATVIGAALVTQLVHCVIFPTCPESQWASEPALPWLICPNSPRGERTSHYHRRDWDSRDYLVLFWELLFMDGARCDLLVMSLILSSAC
jgi:hypothetical protein